MKIYSWNVNGIRSVIRKELFIPFIEQEMPDIVCLQETKANPTDFILQLSAYFGYWNYAQKKGYSGTAIFSKIKPLNVSLNFKPEICLKYKLLPDKYGNPNTEGRLISLEYNDFYLVNVYTPNAKDDLSRIPLRSGSWDPAFLEHCQILEKSKPVIVCGDFNVAHTELDLANPKSNLGKKGFTMEERLGLQNFIEAGFLDTFRLFEKKNGHYTWWSHFANSRERNVGWRIDYFLISKNLKNALISANIHPKIIGSDHCPVSLEIKI